jgi:hypothetical protein
MFDSELLYTAAMFHDVGLTQSQVGVGFASGRGHDRFTHEQRETVIAAYPRQRGNLCGIVMHSCWDPQSCG